MLSVEVYRALSLVERKPPWSETEAEQLNT